MRTTDALHHVAGPGGDVLPATRRAAASELRLGRALRVADVAADLAAAAGARCRGTLDGTITSIQAGEHGVLVRHVVAATA